MGPKAQWTNEANEALIKLLGESPSLRNVKPTAASLKQLKNEHGIFQHFSNDTLKEKILQANKNLKSSAAVQPESKRAAQDSAEASHESSERLKKRRIEEEPEPAGIDLDFLDYPYLAAVYAVVGGNDCAVVGGFVALLEPLRSMGEYKIGLEGNSITLTKSWPESVNALNLLNVLKGVPVCNQLRLESSASLASSSSSTGQSSSSSSSAPLQGPGQAREYARMQRNIFLCAALTQKRVKKGLPEESPLTSTTVLTLPWKIQENSLTVEDVQIGGDVFILVQCFSEETVLKEGTKNPALVKF